MIGKIYWSVFPYYDARQKRNGFKKRPVLIISEARNNDYTVLPVSSVSISSNIDQDYDIKVDPTYYPDLGLTKVCYIRTHKQTIVHRASITSLAGDLKGCYEDLYIEVLAKMEAYQKLLLDRAL